MKQITSASSLPVLALVLVIGIVTGKLWDRQPTQAAQSAVKWEYCMIMDFERDNSFASKNWVAKIYYLQTDGMQNEAGPADPHQEYALRKAIAKLGADGWEMAFASPSPNERMYFKRPKK